MIITTGRQLMEISNIKMPHFFTLSADVAFAFLFFSSSSLPPPLLLQCSQFKTQFVWSLTKLKHPVLLVSSDGFQFGYQYKTPTLNIDSLIDNGNEAERGLIPVFPNHYSIVSGLYPAYHGIVSNNFLDPNTVSELYNGKKYRVQVVALWETVVNHGLKAATYFWAGSEIILKLLRLLLGLMV